MKVKSLVFAAIGALFFNLCRLHAADHKKPVNPWTCEDFLAVNGRFSAYGSGGCGSAEF